MGFVEEGLPEVTKAAMAALTGPMRIPSDVTGLDAQVLVSHVNPNEL